MASNPHALIGVLVGVPICVAYYLYFAWRIYPLCRNGYGGRNAGALAALVWPLTCLAITIHYADKERAKP